LARDHKRETAMTDSPVNLEPRYDVELISVGTKPRRVAWTVASFTDLRNEEAKELLRTAPFLILRNASYATAEGAREALERRGATVEVRACEVDTRGAPPQSSTPPTSWLTALGIVIAVVVILFVILVVVASLIVANIGDPTF
jgi:hypothetical protein